MSFVVCPVVPFPNIYWWSFAAASPALLLDETEHFEKMSLRNRYLVAGADGVITLSIPIAEGRQQRKAMSELLIDTKSNWQIQHWRTLQSVYNRSPYFEFYAPELELFYQQPFYKLTEFSKASIKLLGTLSGIKNEIFQAEGYQKSHPEASADIRSDFRSNQYNSLPHVFPKYQQTFEDRTGFLPNLSMLDLLFAEGRQARACLLKLHF